MISRARPEDSSPPTPVLDVRPAGDDLIEAAMTFMAAQPGAPRRVLDAHRKLGDGRCSRCRLQSTRWPCFVAAIALMIEQRIPSTERLQRRPALGVDRTSDTIRPLSVLPWS